VFPEKYGQTYRVEFQIKDRKMYNVRIVIVIIIYHSHRLRDGINLLGS
jgi:hypothetical protein